MDKKHWMPVSKLGLKFRWLLWIFAATAIQLQAASTIGFTTTIYAVAEDAGAVTLTVQRYDDTNSVVSVDYASTNGTAVAGL